MPRISQLPSLTAADNADEIAIVDVSSSTTKKITRGDLLKAPLPANSVTTAAIDDGAVTAPKIDFETLNFGNYSTSEVNTGFKWIDGKTIYKRTYNFGALPNATSKTLAHGLSMSWLVKYEAVTRRSGGNNEWYSLPLVYNSVSATYNTEIQVNTTDISITSSEDRTAFATTYVTLYYTKV